MRTGSTPGSDVFDRIRTACRAVVDRAAHVRIRTDRIAAYAESLAPTAALPPLDMERHFVGEPRETIAYFLTLAAVNFGSGYFPYLAKRPGMSGYYTIASALTERFRAHGPFTPAKLRAIAPRECAMLFAQDMKSFPVRELMTLYARALRDLGADVERRFESRFEALVASADRSAARLIEILTAQPFFRDAPLYHDLAVPLYKRAQLLTSDLALAFGSDGPGRFDDLDRLTIFADNLVPHVLRVDGLLEYSETLTASIERGELVRPGSDAEIEIRACAVHCGELIRDAMARTGRAASARELDQVLWHRGQGPDYKRIRRHRTRTVFY